MFEIIKAQFPKLFSRTEWQSLLVAIAVMVANRMLDLGLTEADIYAMFAGVAGYGVSRGLTKIGATKTTMEIAHANDFGGPDDDDDEAGS